MAKLSESFRGDDRIRDSPACELPHGKMSDLRTGILLQIDDMRFLVTAAHDLPESIDKDRPPHVVMPDTDRQPVPLAQETFWTTVNHNEDLAVAHLSDWAMRMLGDAHAVFTPTDFILAGIQTSWYKDYEYAKATWTDNLLNIIFERVDL